MTPERITELRRLRCGYPSSDFVRAAMQEMIDEIERLQSASQPAKCKANEAVVALIRERAAMGLKKYGKALSDRDDLTLRDVLQHALEESLDLPIYLVDAIARIDRSEAAGQLTEDDKHKFEAWVIANVDERIVPADERSVGGLIFNVVHAIRGDGDKYTHRAEQDAEIESWDTKDKT